MLQLWASAAIARSSGPGLLGARLGMPQPHHSAPVLQHAFLDQGALGQAASGSVYYGYSSPSYDVPPPGFGAPPLGFSGLPPQQLYDAPSPPSAIWDQHALATGFHTMTLTPPPNM
jgi:hypothetical protein